MSPRPRRERLWAQVGSLVFVLGMLGLSACWLGRTGLLPVELTRLIRRSELIFVMLSLAMILAGCGLLWASNHPRTRWRPRQPGVRFHSIVFYTRLNCDLCEDARELLAGYRAFLPPLVEVDIDQDPEIRARFDTCVPVVEIDSKIRFRGLVRELLLQRLIDGTPPNSTAARRIDRHDGNAGNACPPEGRNRE